MTPFEQAEKNISKLADGLAMMGLIAKTLEETKDLGEAESEIAWAVILSMLQVTGRMGGEN
jgi:hypothetical protein